MKDQDHDLCFYELARRRRSVRRFSTRPVEDDKLSRIMEVGRLAASADNRQPWKFFLLRREGKARFAQLLRDHFRTAPVIIVACASPSKAWHRRFDGRSYAWVDVAIAVTEMVLAATAEGLGTCWVASFDPEGARRALELEAGWEPVTALAVGYSAEPPAEAPKNRKPAAEVWVER